MFKVLRVCIIFSMVVFMMPMAHAKTSEHSPNKKQPKKESIHETVEKVVNDQTPSEHEKKIQSQKFDGGGASSGGSAPSISSSLSGATGGAPSFTLAGASGVNQLANTVQNEKPVKAYVVGNDVTTAQSLERNKIENATL